MPLLSSRVTVYSLIYDVGFNMYKAPPLSTNSFLDSSELNINTPQCERSQYTGVTHMHTRVSNQQRRMATTLTKFTRALGQITRNDVALNGRLTAAAVSNSRQCMIKLIFYFLSYFIQPNILLHEHSITMLATVA